MTYFKPLDVVRTPKGDIGIVTETDGITASVDFIKGCDDHYEYSAWWNHLDNCKASNREDGHDGLVVIDSLLRILMNNMAHPFGGHTKQYEELVLGEEADDDVY